MPVTFKQVRSELSALGVAFRWTGIEYRVVVRGHPEDEAYYTPDLEDALQTGRHMAASRQKPPLLEQVTLSEVQRLLAHLQKSVPLWDCD